MERSERNILKAEKYVGAKKMSIKKKIVAVIAALLVILLNLGILSHKETVSIPMPFHFTVLADQEAEISIFYSPNEGFSEAQKQTVQYSEVGMMQEFMVEVLSDTEYVRVDFNGNAHIFALQNMFFEWNGDIQTVENADFAKEQLFDSNGITDYAADENAVNVVTEGEDPYISAKVGPTQFEGALQVEKNKSTMLKNVIVAVLLDLACVVLFMFRKKFSSLPAELFQNRGLIFKLAKNDFKTKFAGSYLGIFWAFVQPIVTVLVYWFVFQVGLRAPNAHEYPFVLWLVAGLVPWFFFQEALFGGTNALIEYSYLVKKVVFKISTLPLVKVISALFVHGFFVIFTIILYVCYGYFPDLYTMQVVYYTFALFVLTLAICYTTSAVVIFFRDLSQIINIVLQIGVWVTPIMWNIDDMAVGMPRALVLFLKANPLYYIVNGYRDALLNKVWFWERFDLTCAYWLFTGAIFVVGTIIFKRLKVHFADVL